MRPDRAPSRAPPRPAPPGRSPLPARAPRPSLPLSAAAVGPGGRRGRRRAGTARSLAALWAARLSGWTSRLAPRVPRRSRSRLLLSPPPRQPPPPPPLDHEPPRAPGPWLCPSQTGLSGAGWEQGRRARAARESRAPRHGAPGPRLVAAVRDRRAGRLRPRGPRQQESELQRSPPDLRGQGL